MRSIGVWLALGVITLAACGGGDDSSEAVADRDGDATSTASSDDGTDDVAAGDADGDVAADPAPTTIAVVEEDRGPMLVPRLAIDVPESSGGFDGVALSPTGDQVAVVWRALDTDASAQIALTVFDAATGTELASGSDDRLGAQLFWTEAGQLVSGANFGELWEWDPTTAATVSDGPVSQGAFESPNCAPSSEVVLDPASGAVLMLSDGLCRVDLATGEFIEYTPDEILGDLRVGLGGDELYVKWATDDNVLMRRILDAATLEVIADEPADPIVSAISGNGRVERVGGEQTIQPSGRTIGFFDIVVDTSAGGGYYTSDRDGLLTVVSSLDGTSIGSVDSATDRIVDTAWSSDDAVFVVRTETNVQIYDIG